MKEKREHPYIPTLKRHFAEGKVGRREFLRYATLLGVSSAAAYSFTSGRTGTTPAQAGAGKGGKLTIAMPVRDIHDPHNYWSIEASNIGRAVHQYLTTPGPDGIVRPLLAEGWEVSDDLRSWTFHLRKVAWHNGRTFTARDAAWNINRVLHPDTGSSMRGLFTGYLVAGGSQDFGLWDASAVEVLDDHLLRLNLAQPQVTLPEILSHYPMAILDPKDDGKFGVGANGTGPYRLVEYQQGFQAVLEASRTYWGEGPHLDLVRFVHVEDPNTSLSALVSNSVDGVYRLDVGHAAFLEKMSDIRVYHSPTANTAVARMQTDYPPFDDKRVRKAMRLAIDPHACLRRVQGGYGASGEHHHVSPVHPDYAELPFMKRDIDTARRLLAEAGYPDGIDVEIVCKSDPSWELRTVEFMASQWKEAGINVRIRAMPDAQYWDVWNKVPFGFTPWGGRLLGHMAYQLAYASNAPWNESHFSNPEFDRLLSEVEGALDFARRRDLMARLEAIMQEEGPIVQPIWRPAIAAYRAEVQGVRVDPLGYLHVEELSY